MPRFALLYHDCPPAYVRPPHWDLLVESGDVLRTWALAELPAAWQSAHDKTCQAFPACPPLATGNTVAAVRLADHRREYLDFEGELTNHRGTVVRVAEGTFNEQCETRCGWFLSLQSAALNDVIELDRSDSDQKQWTLVVQE